MFLKKLSIAVMFVLVLAAGAVQAGGDAARGEELSVNCADCHGANGEGMDDAPAIAGLDEMEHFEALKAYKSGERADESGMMLMFTEELSEQDMADLAAYYATLGGS
jgi:cytochrome c553